MKLPIEWTTTDGFYLNFDRGDKFRDGRDQLASTDDRPVVSSSVQVSRVVQEKVGLCRCKRHQLMNYQLDRVVDISRFKAARCMHAYLFSFLLLLIQYIFQINSVALLFRKRAGKSRIFSIHWRNSKTKRIIISHICQRKLNQIREQMNLALIRSMQSITP